MATTATPQGEVLDAGPLQIAPEEHLAKAGGRPLTMSVRELRLLTELARRLDRIVSREELFLLVWGKTMRSGDRSVDVYIRKLRVKLGVALPEWTFIHTHFGLGYRLSAERRANGAAPVHVMSSQSVGAAVSEHAAPAPAAPIQPDRSGDFTTG